MQSRRTCIRLILAIFAGLEIVDAQSSHEPFRVDTALGTNRANEFVSLGFDKNLGTYQWEGVLALRRRFGVLDFDLLEQFRSTIIQTSRKLIRDEQSLDFRTHYHISRMFAPSIHVSNFVLSDDQRVGDGQRPGVTSASSNAVYGGVEAEVIDNAFVEPLVGARFENQVGVRDRGLSYAIRTWTPGMMIGGYQSRFEGKYQKDLLQPRTLEQESLFVGIGKAFLGRSKDTLEVRFRSNQRDFYFAADTTTARDFAVSHNIERRKEEAIAINNTLDYGLGERVLLTIRGDFASRTIDRSFHYRPLLTPVSRTLINTTVNEFRIGGSAQVAYKIEDDLNAALLLMVNERDERHVVQPDERISTQIDLRARDEAKKDNVSFRTMLASSLNVALGSSNRLMVSGSTSLLRYDTPSEGNNDDRDELWYSMNLSTIHVISRYLTMRMNADVNLTHLVYLFKERSANNSWNRVFRLFPRVEYSPTEDISTTNTFEVLANYTVYDFEDTPAVQVKSFSFRQFAFVDSTHISISSRQFVEGFANVRLYQRGEFRWDEFKERPLNEFVDKTFIAKVGYQTGEGLHLSVGVRYFSQIRFGFASGSRVFETELRSVGPVATLRWEIGSGSSVVIDGWYERQTQTHAAPRGFSNMSMTLHVRL